MAKVAREEKKLLKAIKKNPQDPAPLVELGWMHFGDHSYNEAKQRFMQALELQASPQISADAEYGLALIEQHAGQYEEAKERLRKIFTICSDFSKRAEVHFRLAEVSEYLWRKAEWKNEQEKTESELLQRAIDHYQQAIERRSQQQSLACYYLGSLYYDLNRSEEAVDFLKRALSGPSLSNNDAFEACYLLGKIFQEQPEQLHIAREYFQEALKKGAKAERLAPLHKQLGEITLQQGYEDQAVEHFEQALKHYKDTQTQEVLAVLVNLGELKIRHHWFQEAIDYGERALQIRASSPSLQQQLAKVLAEGYYGIRNYEKAEVYEHQCFNFSKEDQAKAESLWRLGTIYEHLNIANKAQDAYRKGLKFTTKNQTLSELNGALGRLYFYEERLNQAVKHLKEAAGLADGQDPHTSTIYRLLGDCHLKRNETEKAIEMYGTIIAKYPNSGEEPTAREALKRFRKQFKREIQERERAQKQAEEEQISSKETDTSDLERLTELVNDILDEKGFFERLKEGLAKTHLSLVSRIEELLAGRTTVDDDLIENLEEVLILSDLGVATTQRIIEAIQEKVKRKELEDPTQLKQHLKREVQEILQHSEKRLDLDREKPFVILVIGVNGTGKTTSIGKMASKFKALGKEVLLVAGDTFRAAAIEQLEIWGERAGCDVIKHTSGADPSAVLYDAIHAAKSRNVDVVVADTAGRLHTKKNLMEELKKMFRVIAREMPGAPHEVLMVIDATTGQNAISQAKLFHEGVGVTGLVLTKLDGTAKGGIIVSIAHDLQIPVTYIGIGEKVEDLREFHAKEFVEALFED